MLQARIMPEASLCSFIMCPRNMKTSEVRRRDINGVLIGYVMHTYIRIYCTRERQNVECKEEERKYQ
jgi:hypothetical protein